VRRLALTALLVRDHDGFRDIYGNRWDLIEPAAQPSRNQRAVNGV